MRCGYSIDAIWVCTYKCARVWPDLPSHGNQPLRSQVGLINPVGVDRAKLVPHRALSDAIVTAAVFFELTRHARWPELVQWSYEPALLTYFRFGMHRGERFDAAPEDYLRWIGEPRPQRGCEVLGALLAGSKAGR